MPILFPIAALACYNLQVFLPLFPVVLSSRAWFFLFLLFSFSSNFILLRGVPLLFMQLPLTDYFDQQPFEVASLLKTLRLLGFGSLEIGPPSGL